MLPPVSPVRDGRVVLAAGLLAAVVGLAALLVTLPAEFIFGTGAYWSHPEREGVDGIAALTGLRYFLADGWRWPLLNVRGFGPGYAISAIYTDSVPLLALALKAVGIRDANPYGWWVAASFVLTPIAAVRVGWQLGARSLVAAFAIAVFAATLPILQLRLVHPALTAHWVFLFAVELHIRRRNGHPWVVAEAALPAIALGIHPYLLALCLGPLWAAFGADAWRAVTLGERLRIAAHMAAGVGVLLAFAAVIGLRPPPFGGMEREWGDYSMNLLSPVWPRFSAIYAFPEDALSEPGQADGRAWLGFGALGLLVAALGFVPAARQGLRRHWPLAATCLAYLAFAVTTRPALGPVRLFDWYPELLSPAVETFRASGRFAWLPAWVAVIAAAALLARTPGGRMALLALAALQVADTVPVRLEAARIVAAVRVTGVSRDAALAEISGARRIEMWPPYDCIRSYVLHDVALDVLVLASEARTPIDSVRAARPVSDCPAAWRRAQEPATPEGTLRIFLAEGTEVRSLPSWTAGCPEIPAEVAVTIRACGAVRDASE